MALLTYADTDEHQHRQAEQSTRHMFPDIIKLFFMAYV